MVHEDFVQVMQLVSGPLRMDLHFEIYSPSLSAHPFFALYMIACEYITKRICHKAMSMSFLSPGDVVFNTGEIPTHPKMLSSARAPWTTICMGSSMCSRELSSATLPKSKKGR